MYSDCPLCGSPAIKLGSERLNLSRRDGEEVTIRVRRWACPDCGERLLTRDARRQLDLALSLQPRA